MNYDQTDTDVIFFDDFRPGELDRTKWNVRTTGPVYNDEQQAYVDSSETIYIAPNDEEPETKNGLLVIHPRHRTNFVTPEGNRFDFISGRIDTRGKFDFCYGTAAARIRLPAGSGVWPAFWLIGDGKWPKSGEIDIMEYVGREPDLVVGTVHGPGYAGAGGLSRWNRQDFPLHEAFHTYAIEWDFEGIRWYFDGELYYDLGRDGVGEREWVFDQPFFIILNLALGGTLGGQIGLDTQFPLNMYVDYVRVYQPVSE